MVVIRLKLQVCQYSLILYFGIVGIVGIVGEVTNEDCQGCQGRQVYALATVGKVTITGQ